ncbi:PLD nuclease N-terminal domain-containing protein [Kitasatospora mediocidica]|uniref:PLD nuclease N-terminal domain-containing protein n=1 Tax=Kitasatospora mediocidica TaxID=58352 RepID=UPI00055CB3FF|nr:PLD nuclease N-terminal domain-containing protein [Kitasatospora mediocidica]
MLRLLPYVIVLGLWAWAFIDCLTTPEQEVRHLPKVVWVIIILLFGEVLIGPIAWLAAGRQRGAGARAGGRLSWSTGEAPGDDDRPTPPPTGHSRGGRPLAPDDDPEFLASLGRENKRHEAMLAQWEADLRRREQDLRGSDQPEDEHPEDGAGRPKA